MSVIGAYEVRNPYVKTPIQGESLCQYQESILAEAGNRPEGRNDDDEGSQQTRGFVLAA